MTRLTVSRLVAVTAVGHHGSTEEIADRVADRLRAWLPGHWNVIRCSPVDPLLDDADAVVLGSAIYLGRWMPAARACLERLQQVGPEHVWLFSSGPVADEQRGQRERVLSPAVVPWRTHGHQVFGGRLDIARLSNIERFLTRMVGALQGDRRDWSDIDSWAATIAEHLVRAYAEHDPGTAHPVVPGGRRSRLDLGRWSP
ncbi:flavodoxin domain-containing protein [Aeromicrobium sp.]|uniref:flavodoxin domain-containing protein n=1 Tax=Aeromicrobium sp. TaxID=1871063 RepID=UPI003D6B1EB5